jgi:2-polyprenyl-6-hydroxyphenyl methylase/3-demethylubiquinone-9 3-methyltransferase
MLQAARTLSEKSANSATLSFDHVADLARLPFADSAFAGVLCSSVLEYLSAPDAALAEFARVLRPGGMLVISVPNRHALSRKVQVVCRSLGKRFGCEWFNYLQISRNWYADAEFRHCLKAHGMTGERQATFGGPFSRSIHQSPMWGSLIMFAARRK